MVLLQAQGELYTCKYCRDKTFKKDFPISFFSNFHYRHFGKGQATKLDEYSEKCQRGGGAVIYNPKIYIADFGDFKQVFLSMKLIKRRVISGFRVCFFQ